MTDKPVFCRRCDLLIEDYDGSPFCLWCQAESKGEIRKQIDSIRGLAWQGPYSDNLRQNEVKEAGRRRVRSYA